MLGFLYKMLQIRLKQTYRLLQSIGWGYLLILVALILPIFGFRLLELLVQTDLLSGTLILLIPAFYIHFYRRDHLFLRQIASYVWRTGLFVMEYILALFPLWLALLYYQRSDLVLGLIAGISLIAAVDKKWTPAIKWKTLSLNWIPLRAFEWRAGLRRLGVFIAFFWLIGLVASHWMWAIPGTVIICSFFCTSMYELLEPKELLEGPFDVRRIIWQKIGLHSLFFHLLFGLPYLVFFIRHADLWWIMVLVIVAVQLLLSFSILVKYANWLPHRRQHNGQTILSVFALGLLVPFLAPASLALWVYYYFKAKKRLDFFYHAQD